MRLFNWESRLSSYITRVASEGFALGTHDCALFAAGGVEAVTGTDPAADWRGKYNTMASGLRLVRTAGYEDHVVAAAALHPQIAAGDAMPGDLAVVPTEEHRLALGIVQGSLVYVLSRDRIGLVPSGAAVKFLGVR